MGLFISMSVVGCGNAESATSVDPGVLINTEEVQLKWYVVGNWPQIDQDRVFEEVSQTLKEKINASCEIIALGWGDYESKINVVISSGQEYDVCFTSDWMNNYAKNVRKGAFAPLDDLLREHASTTWGSMPETYWNAVRVNGKIYAVINQQVFSRTPAVMIPREYAQTYNINLPSFGGDYANLTPYLERVHADHPEIAVRVGGIWTSHDNLAGVSIPGAVKRDDAALVVFNQFKSDEFRKAVDTIREWNDKGFTRGTEFLISQPKAAPGEILWSAEIDGSYKPSNAIYNGQGIEIQNYPFSKSLMTTSGITATMQAINANSRNKERAMQMLEIFNSDPEAYMLLNYGLKGRHWDVNADGLMTDGRELVDKPSYAPSLNWMFATNFMQIPFAHEGKDIWERTRKFNEEAHQSVAFGFSFDAAPVKGAMAKCAVIVDNYSAGLKLGVYSAEEVETMIHELDDAGADEIIAEMQKQVDEWKRKK